MLLKWITLQPTETGRTAFIAGQMAWQALANIPGFLCQIAGWSKDDNSVFGLLALWESEQHYKEFMAVEHDRIGIHQLGTFGFFKGYLSEVRMIIGNFRGFPLEAKFVRVADCRLLPASHARFWQVQEEVWNPGMSATPGMLGGVAAATVTEEERCIIATFWETEEAHIHYQTAVFPDLRLQAPANDHLVSVEGYRLILNPSWRVTNRRVALSS